MTPVVRRQVQARGGGRCEYCRLPQFADPFPFHVEHVIARKHGGGNELGNLALACDTCNLHKGSDLAGIDPRTGRLTRLFHPRRDLWRRHFEWNGVALVGRTAIGRTTARVLAMNSPEQVAAREALSAGGHAFG